MQELLRQRPFDVVVGQRSYPSNQIFEGGAGVGTVFVELFSFDFDSNDGRPRFMIAGNGLDLSKTVAIFTRKASNDIISFLGTCRWEQWRQYNSQTLTTDRSMG